MPNENKMKKEGVHIKGKDAIFLDAPEIRFSENDLLTMENEDTEVTDTELKIKSCGDGLYYIGGDLFCTYKLLGTAILESSVIFDYEKYTVTVSWENTDDNTRKNPKWVREYKTNTEKE